MRRDNIATIGILLFGFSTLIMCGAAELQSFITECGTIEFDAPWKLDIIADDYHIPGDISKTEYGRHDGYCYYAFKKSDDDSLMFEITIYDDEQDKTFKEWVEESVTNGLVTLGDWDITNDGKDMYWTKDPDNNWRMTYINLTNENKEAAEIDSYLGISDDPSTLYAISKSFKLTPLSVPGFEMLLVLICFLVMSHFGRKSL